MKEITLTNGMLSLVDDADFDHLSQFNWCPQTNRASKMIYAKRFLRGERRQHVLMHHDLMGKPPAGFVWDHIDQNSLNNQRSNLRLASISLNIMNASPRKDNTSGYRGVSPRDGKWLAVVCYRGHRYDLGLHATPKEAFAAYEAKRRVLLTDESGGRHCILFPKEESNASDNHPAILDGPAK